MLPVIEANPPSEDRLRMCWPLSRRVPLREIFLSLGLEDPGPLPVALDAAVEDSFVADPEGDTEAFVADDGMGAPDFPEDPPVSDDDMPLVPPSY